MVLLASGVAKAKPHVERWWRETVRPSVQAQRARLRERRSRRRLTKDNGAASGSTLNATVELFDAADEDRPKMSRAEAQARYLAAMAAKAYSEEQLRLVAGADVLEGDSPAELRRSLTGLPAEEVAGLIHEMVTNPALLNEQTLAELASVLGRRQLPSARQASQHPE